MAACDSHEALYGTPSTIPNGEGFLFAARFIQNSEIQEKNIEIGMKMAGAFMTREEYKLEVESQQGSSPWIICEKCVSSLNLSKEEIDAARNAAIKWWNDKSSPGYMPGSDTSPKHKKPSHFLIFGNGFMPTEDQSRSVMLGWLNKRKDILGEDAVAGVRSSLRFQPQTNRDDFFKIVKNVQSENPNQTIDDIIMLDQRGGKDVILVAIWAPEDSEYIKSLLQSKNSDQNEPSDKSGCFIATACYGSPYSDNVLTLQWFRDEYLLSSYLGKKLIVFYYNISPPISRFISKRNSLKRFIEYCFLNPFVNLVKLLGNYHDKKKSIDE